MGCDIVGTDCVAELDGFSGDGLSVCFFSIGEIDEKGGALVAGHKGVALRRHPMQRAGGEENRRYLKCRADFYCELRAG